jgi:hypothetical protein
MKRWLFAMSVFVFFGLVTSRQAAACDLCKAVGLVCSADTCDIVFVCQPQSFGKNSYADCWEDYWGCHTGTEFCRWASLVTPVCKEPVLFGHEKAS